MFFLKQGWGHGAARGLGWEEVDEENVGVKFRGTLGWVLASSRVAGGVFEVRL